ncbi:MAG: Gfo/Idh/MocA family oxidoreductase [Candidatus Micrarchaeia archaeon]
MKILVVGAGSMGRHHVRVYSEMPEVERVLVVDPNPAAAEKFKDNPKVKFCASVAEALAEKPVAASIATPTPFHLETALPVINAGVPCLVEKPLCETVPDAKKLLDAARAKNVLVMPGHLERFNPAILALKKNAGLLGKLVYASTHRYGVPSFNRQLGDALVDLAVHDIDLLSFITNERPSLVSALERRLVEGQANDLCAALFEFDGFTAAVEANRVSPIKVRELTLVGTEGLARVDYTKQELSIYRLEVAPSYHEYKTFNELVTRAGQGSELKIFIQKDEPLKLELRHFLDCVAGKTKPLVTGEDGLYALASVQAAAKAAKSAKKEEIRL